MTQGKRFLSERLPSTVEGMLDRSSHINKVHRICQCYLLYGSNEKLYMYFNKFETKWEKRVGHHNFTLVTI